jgi:hypothetical protein
MRTELALVDDTVNRFFARTVIVSLLGVVGMSLGCDKSPAAPASVTAPSAAAVSSVSVNGSTDVTF